MTTIQTSYEWAIRVIDSCNDGFQLEAAAVVIELFARKYGEGKETHDLLDRISARHAQVMIR